MPSPSLSLLGESDREYLLSEAIRLLEQVGARFESAKARAVLADAGCKVDGTTHVVRFPRDVVEWTISKFSRDWVLAARDPGKDALLDGQKTYAANAGICPYFVDGETGLHKEPALEDLSQVVRVLDALDEVGLCWFPMSPSADVPASVSDLFTLGCLLANTSKHIQGQLVRPEDVPVAVEMIRIAAPDADPKERPIFSSLYTPLSPLDHETGTIEAAMAMAAEHIPIDIFALPLAGATSPMTLAGTVAQTLAEELSAAVLFKLVNENASIILSAVASIMDMRSSRFLTSAPEVALMSAALTELVHSINAPALINCTPTDAYDLGFRAGLETMGNGVLNWLMHPEIAVGMGMVEMAQAVSLPKLVLDAEVLQYYARIAQGLTVDEEHVAADVIDEVGPGGHFLDHRTTSKFLRSGEHWFPKLFWRSGYEDWVAGAPDSIALATQRANEILAEHQPQPLPHGADEAINEVLVQVQEERTGVRSRGRT